MGRGPSPEPKGSLQDWPRSQNPGLGGELGLWLGSGQLCLELAGTKGGGREREATFRWGFSGRSWHLPNTLCPALCNVAHPIYTACQEADFVVTLLYQ